MKRWEQNRKRGTLPYYQAHGLQPHGHVTYMLLLYYVLKCRSNLQNNAAGVHPVLVSDASFTRRYLMTTNLLQESEWEDFLSGLPSADQAASAHFITASSIAEEPLVCFEPPGSASLPSSLSLPSVLPKNTEQIKPEGLICVGPTVGKARAQEQEQERRDGDLKTEMCAQGRSVFLEAC